MKSNLSERILFYCKDSETNNHIQRVSNFQQLKPIGDEPISEVMKRTFFWIDILSPTKEEIAVLSDVSFLNIYIIIYYYIYAYYFFFILFIYTFYMYFLYIYIFYFYFLLLFFKKY